MKMKITLHGVAYEVEVEVLDEGDGFYDKNSRIPKIIPSVDPTPTFSTSPAQHRAPEKTSSPDSKDLKAPVGGTIVEIKSRPGDKVAKGEEILILEAMKMHTSMCAPADVVIKHIAVAAGDTVREGQVLVEFE